MNGKFRFIGVTPGLIDGKHIEAMGQACWLFQYLVCRQTHPDGRVNHGKPLTYQQIASDIPNCPPERTLKRWMAKLRAYPYVAVRPVKYRGMVVRILNAKKWARQLDLFHKTTASASTESATREPRLAPNECQEWPRNSSKEKRANEREQPRSQVPFYATRLGRRETRDELVRRELQVGAGPEVKRQK